MHSFSLRSISTLFTIYKSQPFIFIIIRMVLYIVIVIYETGQNLSNTILEEKEGIKY